MFIPWHVAGLGFGVWGLGIFIPQHMTSLGFMGLSLRT